LFVAIGLDAGHTAGRRLNPTTYRRFPMAFNPDDIRTNRDYFTHKLRAERQRNDVLKAVEGSAAFDFVLLDTRGAEAFAHAHIPGAWSIPPEKVDEVAALLPKDREIVTYCWGHD
jgi:Rhodanese-like domain